MALKKGINVRHGMQFGDRGATSASELAYDANTTTKQKIDAIATEVAGKADLTDLAPAFSTATAYTVGQYVSYGGNIYKCTSAHSAGAWAAGDFTLVAVGSELEGKQDTLTFDNAPTDGSNNPVKSDGIYDALAGKQDIFERISYADWQLLTPQQQAAKPYYIYDYPSTQITAANVSYDHTQSGLSATTAQGGIDELASEKQDATDNSLQTTDKTIVGGINELKSGLTGLETVTVLTVTPVTNANYELSTYSKGYTKAGVVSLFLDITCTTPATSAFVKIGSINGVLRTAYGTVICEVNGTSTLTISVEDNGDIMAIYGEATKEYRSTLTAII